MLRDLIVALIARMESGLGNGTIGDGLVGESNADWLLAAVCKCSWALKNKGMDDRLWLASTNPYASSPSVSSSTTPKSSKRL